MASSTTLVDLLKACAFSDAAGVRTALEAADGPAAAAATGADVADALVAGAEDAAAWPVAATGSALHTALRAGSVECAQLLIDAGASATALDDSDGLRPLHLLARLTLTDEDTAALEAALGGGDASGDGDGATEDADADGLEEGAAGGAGGDGGDADGGDGLPAGGVAGLLRSLLAAGADIDAPDESGNGPLAYAAQFGAPEMVDLLLTAGADINATDEDGDTALHCASYVGNPGTVAALLAAGADDRLKDKSGVTPADMRRARRKKVPRVEADGWGLLAAAEYAATMAASGDSPAPALPSEERLAALDEGFVANVTVVVAVPSADGPALAIGTCHVAVEEKAHGGLLRGTLLDVPDIDGTQNMFFVGKELWFRRNHVNEVLTSAEAEAATS